MRAYQSMEHQCGPKRCATAVKAHHAAMAMAMFGSGYDANELGHGEINLCRDEWPRRRPPLQAAIVGGRPTLIDDSICIGHSAAAHQKATIVASSGQEQYIAERLTRLSVG